MNRELLTIADWRAAYRGGASPRDLLQPLLARRSADDPAWILRCDDDFIAAQFLGLDKLDPATAPLYGVPFAVKDNIDVAGLRTTAACAAFAYTASRDASVVARLIAAGAVLVGKTNLDQFATGLVGTRSPFGAVPNSFDPRYVSGGSSSGSASVVARGLVAFALGTDTAGSGRVPAGFNNLVGFKPTPGRVGMAGVVPACRTLDVVSVFALSVADAAEVMALIEGDDEAPAFQSHALRRSWLGESGRPLRIAVPAAPDCDRELGYAGAFDDAVLRLRQLGAQVETIAMDALFDVAALLYDGPWVAERYAVVRELIESSPDAIDPVVRQVISAARRHDAVSAFEARYRLEDLRQRVAPMWQRFDLLVVPTAPTCPTLAAVAAEPVLRNSELGRFTNFVNLLGMCAISLPSGFTAAGLPFGITAIAPGGSDAALAVFGARWEAASALPLGAHLRRPGDPPTPTPLRTMPAAAATLQIAVVGAHLQGLPLHSQLVERGCRLVDKTTTSACYRLCALPRTTPAKPGLARLAEGEAGSAIEVEVYEMPLAEVGSLLALIAPPLGLGSVELADGRWVKGFVCEGAAIAGAVDISGFGGWRAYLASR